MHGWTLCEYTIVISYTGYISATVSDVDVSSSTTKVIEEAELKLLRAIHGNVKLAGKSSSAGITVNLVKSNYDTEYFATTTTDVNGDFTLMVPPGRYFGINYSKVDFQDISISYDIVLSKEAIKIDPFTLNATQNTVKGYVVIEGFADNASLVTLYFADHEEFGTYTTSEDGTFIFEHIPLGTYTLNARYLDSPISSNEVVVETGEYIDIGEIVVVPY